ncbi:FxLYD domain-containing protein [Pseudomonas sp. AL03]|uniref:FxLYD domain-containing protein n=1 Tax=Pseudomonas sp. AL03 TaxID=3042230 RepID=UPI00249C8C39|nr:FxLYD domain-containing protein [Pseudomonas sp. AL03]MDI3274866.1 FxLYD domain-containing protein [Pseudomonas sp. AL03]
MRKILAIAAMLISAVASADDRLSFTGIKVVNTDGAPAVQGYARNTTNAQFNSVTVVFKLYDRSGNMVGNAIANGMGLGPNESWKFTAPAGVAFDRAEVTSVQIM